MSSENSENVGENVDLFDEFIEYDPVDVKGQRAKNKQFNLIADFMKENNEASIDKDVFNGLWEQLTVKLNAAGPPEYSSDQWKTKWTSHKYNQNARKRKALENLQLENIPAKTIRQSQSSSFDPMKNIATTSSTSSSTYGSDTVLNKEQKQDVMIQKQDVMIQKQDVMIQKQEAVIDRLDKILEKLDKTNTNLENLGKADK